MLSAFLLGACGNLGRGVEESTAALPQLPSYRLSPGDKLKVNIFNEPDLTGEFQIGDDGMIAFPLIGQVRAGGMSADEFKTDLVGHLRNGYVRNPRVTVEVVNYRPVNIIGEVRNAGQFTYRPGISVQDAIAMAGGYTYRANTQVVYLTRGGSAQEITLNLKKDETPLLPGDNIRVPERYF